MPAGVKWFLDNQIIEVTLSGALIPDDIRDASQTIVNLMETSGKPVIHVLADRRNVTSLPKSINTLHNVTGFLSHPRMGWFLVNMGAEQDTFTVFISTVITGVAKVRYRWFRTLEGCLEFLVTVDKALPPVDEMLD